MIGPARRIPRRRAAALFVLLVTAAACGSRKSPALPTAGGASFPDAAAAYTEATAQCRTVRTLSAELGLSGRAGGQKLRGHILGGFAEPGTMRLEAPAPFGRAIFTLAMHDDAATLVLNREGRVLRNAPPAELIEALTGVALNPDELRAAVAGCGFGAAERVDGGQSYPGDWVTVESAQAASGCAVCQARGGWSRSSAITSRCATTSSPPDPPSSSVTGPAATSVGNAWAGPGRTAGIERWRRWSRPEWSPI